MIAFGVALIVLQVSLGTTFVVVPRATTGCSIVISNQDPEPIVVSSSSEFLYPELNANSATVEISTGQSVTISCPGGQITDGSSEIGQTITGTCQSGTTFTISQRNINFNQLTCSVNPSHTARYTGQTCGGNGREIEIGFILDTNRFARQMLICFDDEKKTPFYSFYKLTGSIGYRETGVPRPTFVEDSFYNLGKEVNDLYARNGQRTTINKLLGLDENSTKYIKDSNNYYLSRGHLTAKADYVYAPQQQGTFHYCNAAPQWQTFNGGNWDTIEAIVRDYAGHNKVDLEIYTGTYGVSTLPHEATKKDVPLYLFVDSNKNTALPVPELFWKVVYNPKSKGGVALLGINNPYQTDVNKSIICNNTASSLTWVSWKPTVLDSGYSYACTVDELREKVPNLPQFEVTQLL